MGLNTIRGMCGDDSRRPYGTAGGARRMVTPGFTRGYFHLLPPEERRTYLQVSDVRSVVSQILGVRFFSSQCLTTYSKKPSIGCGAHTLASSRPALVSRVVPRSK